MQEGTNTQALLNWQCLHDWAAAKPEGYEMGQSCTNIRCPVANYLGEMTQKLWSVGPSIRSMNGENRVCLDKPAWMNTLLKGVDATGRNVPITREQFLGILEHVKP